MISLWTAFRLASTVESMMAFGSALRTDSIVRLRSGRPSAPRHGMMTVTSFGVKVLYSGMGTDVKRANA